MNFALLFGLLCLTSPALSGISLEKTVSAAVVWTENGGFQVRVLTDDDIPAVNDVAWARFNNAINETGWAVLEVETNATYPDDKQAYAAGLLEGKLTWQLMYWHWINTLNNTCDERQDFCDRLTNYLDINTEAVRNKSSKYGTTDPFWHQISLFYSQLDGLAEGWRQGALENNHTLDIGEQDFLWFNIVGDLFDFERIFNGTKEDSEQRGMYGKGYAPCSVLIKVLPGNADLYVSHNSWIDYKYMLRIQKRYNFKYHETADPSSPLVPGQVLTFTSYPGYLHSLDDFYVISSGLFVTETTIDNNNEELWKNVNPETQILEGPRVMAANRLSTSGCTWSNYFARYNGGTYNNEWMIVNYNLFVPNQPTLEDGLLWVLEQMPGTTHSGDQTRVLRNASYWASYNVPYYEDIFDISDTQSMVDRYGDLFSHENAPRARIFRRDHDTVVDFESMVRLMRYNKYMQDPLSACLSCTPIQNAMYAISARNDLNPANGTYMLPSLGHKSLGAIDLKVTNYSMFTSQRLWCVAGPTHDDQPVFQWSTSGFPDSHVGQPDVWDFEPFDFYWIWSNISHNDVYPQAIQC